MTTVSHGKPYAGNPHVWFEERDPASAEPRRKSLLHKSFFSILLVWGMKCLHSMLGFIVAILFAYFFLVTVARSPEAAMFNDDRFKIVLCLSTMVVILFWMLMNAYIRCRWAGWVGGLLLIYASLVFAGVYFEYSKLFGVDTIIRGGGFKDVCVSAKDAIDIVQNESSGIITSVDVRFPQQDGAAMLICFAANGKDGASWVGHGIKLTSNNVKWTIKRDKCGSVKFSMDNTSNPTNNILDAYDAFLVQDRNIESRERINISWNHQLKLWERRE